MDFTVYSGCCGSNVFVYSSDVRLVNESLESNLFNDSVEPAHLLNFLLSCVY